MENLEEKKGKMTKKKKKIIYSSVIIFVIILAIITGILISNNSKNKKNIKNENQVSQNNQIKNNIQEKEDEESGIKEEDYSDLYKEYLKLPEEEKEKVEVIPRKLNIPIEKLDEIKKEEEKSNSKNQNISEETNNENKNDTQEIPKKFNLADKIDIKVEDQKHYGLCWAFTSIKTLETYLAVNGLGNYDFSEMHLDYVESDLLCGNRKLHTGGNFDCNFNNYINNNGVVDEKEVPYKTDGDYSKSEYNNFLKIKKSVQVTETVDFPTMRKDENFEKNYTQEQVNDFRNTVKKHIMKNGGVYAYIDMSGGLKQYYNIKYFRDFGNKIISPHAVTIVGWDDNYSKEHFKKSIDDDNIPKNNGAYIAVNSWGSNWGEEQWKFDYSKVQDDEILKGGYFYISYEDYLVESNLSGILSTSLDSTYKIDSIKNTVIRDYIMNNYENYLIDYNGSKYITKNQLSTIYTLDLSNKNLTSLDNIDIFSNVYSINLSNNNISDISKLQDLKCLNTINLANNKIKDISPLKNNKIINLDISSNIGITEIENLPKTIKFLNISKCGIKDITSLSNLQGLLGLDISSNIGITGIENLPKTVSSLNISQCGIKDISSLSKLQELYNLDISSNIGITGIENLPKTISLLNISNCQLNTLENLNNMENLNMLDVSGNKIINWEKLEEIAKKILEKNDNDNNEEQDTNAIVLKANNCGITDISIFNSIPLSSIELQENNITDVSKFNNNTVNYIDLSKNENISGLESLKNIQYVCLNNCNIYDVKELEKLENTYCIDVTNNHISGIVDISNFKNLSSIDLSNNIGITKVLQYENLSVINLNGCDITNDFDFSQFKNCELGLLNNPKLNKYSEIIGNGTNNITIQIDEINSKELEKITFLEDENTYIYAKSLIINENIIENNKISSDFIRDNVLKIMHKANMIQNGKINKSDFSIIVKDPTKNFVIIGGINKFEKNCFYNDIKIMLNQKQENNNENINQKNEIVVNNIVNNNITNNIKNENNKVTNTINGNNVINNTINNTNSSSSDVNIIKENIPQISSKIIRTENYNKYSITSWNTGELTIHVKINGREENVGYFKLSVPSEKMSKEKGYYADWSDEHNGLRIRLTIYSDLGKITDFKWYYFDEKGNQITFDEYNNRKK